MFIYKSGDGNDVITDYAAQDKISITGGTYTKSTVGNDVKIKVGSGSILLKNAKNKAITINNSRNFIETPWFATDDNCNSAQLDSILKIDSAPSLKHDCNGSSQLNELKQNNDDLIISTNDNENFRHRHM